MELSKERIAELIEERGLDPEMKEYADPDTGYTFRVGDTVQPVEESEMDGLYEGDEYTVLGFFKVGPAGDPEMARQFGNNPDGWVGLVIEQEGMDATSCKPHQVEIV